MFLLAIKIMFWMALAAGIGFLTAWLVRGILMQDASDAVNNTLGAQLVSRDADINASRERERVLAAQIASLAREKSDALAVVTRISEELNAERTAHAVSQAALVASHTEHAATTDAVATHLTTIAELTSQLHRTRAEATAATKQLLDKATSLTTTQQRLESAHKDIEQLRTVADEQTAAYEALVMVRDELQRERDAFVVEQDRAMAEMERLHTALAERTNERDARTKERDHRIAERESLVAERGELLQERDRTHKEFETLRETIAVHVADANRMRREIAELRIQLDQRASEISTLTAARDTVANERDDRQQRLVRLEGELAALLDSVASYDRDKHTLASRENASDPDQEVRESDHDQLEHINGVGRKLATLLRSHGVHTFRQIASWTESDIDAMDQKLNVFRGRIRRENWVSSARQEYEKKYGREFFVSGEPRTSHMAAAPRSDHALPADVREHAATA